ncbi:envelope stress response membrane protein PspC [Sphingomonas naphthae]|uniref:Envelope stress response membrane protein PspC n=1 Tax=Sphingomonas naphthae TaxID=1813468 RepID=A0ABY7TH86_9SPHN|nr:envelope stress response membrane protein PspC [Sphingomonas naphthae]WCT72315.1 envelope stress response membrane protein PspC [Sphingomonas naphthae]
MEPRRTKFYLDKKNGKVMGVCAGLADYTGLDVTLIRIGFVLLMVGTGTMGGFGPLAYFIAGWMADDRPRELDYADREDKKFWQGVRAKPANSVREVRARFRDIDRRLADVEVSVTSQNRRLADEIEALR